MKYVERARVKAERLRELGRAHILAVESSCDETAMAIVADGRRTLSSAVTSQIDLHAVYGGVVPEIASRIHVESLDLLLDEVLKNGDMAMGDIDAVAVTNGPGLVGALLTGVSWAKAFAYALDVPMIPVNHIEGHVSANYLAHPELEPPFVCLVASGGHSHIVLVENYGRYRLIGQTVDDAAGEAFDKVARVLGIPYPGGPLLDRIAEEGNEMAFSFPRPKLDGKYDFSFSGLKTAAINKVHTLEQQGVLIDVKDFAASFRRSIVDELAGKTIAAAMELKAEKVALAGGVAANRLLRREIERMGGDKGRKVYMPPLSLCTDNAEMIGSAAYYGLMAGKIADLSLNAVPTLRWIG